MNDVFRLPWWLRRCHCRGYHERTGKHDPLCPRYRRREDDDTPDFEAHIQRQDPLPPLVKDALISEAYAAHMYAGNPDLPPEARWAYEWAERQLLRIAKGEVDERDWIG